MAISEIQAIQQELKTLKEEAKQQQKKNQLTFKNVSVWSQSYYQQKPVAQINKHRFGVYADKQLTHLVISQLFDFKKIADILSYSFQNQPEKYSQTTCRERWYQIHRDWQTFTQVHDKIKQNKRVQSILNMSNPFGLYNVSEMLDKLQKDQLNQSMQPRQTLQYPTYNGYNILKDSIRRIDNLQEYQNSKKAMHKALQLAQLKSEQQKPMLYTPIYETGCQFQLKEEQLTLQRMKELMSYKIQMQLIDRQLKLEQRTPEVFQSKIKNKIQRQKEQKQYQNQIEDNWDEYESD